MSDIETAEEIAGQCRFGTSFHSRDGLVCGVSWRPSLNITHAHIARPVREKKAAVAAELAISERSPTAIADTPPKVVRIDRQLGEITSYKALIEVCRQRANQLRLSRESIDGIAGWADRLAGKLLSPNATKRLGALTLEPMMFALGMKLIAVEDPETLERYRDQRVPRAENQVRTCSWLDWGDPIC